VHLTSSPVDWYVVRASGLVAYVLLTTAVAIGLGLAGKERVPRWPRFAVEDLHRFAGTLVGVFVAVHLISLAIDAYLPFSVADLIVPFASGYRPFWTAMGVVALELLLALAVTNRLRNRLSYRFWRRVHYVNFVVWVAATAHGIGGGSDSDAAWTILLYVCSITLVAALALRRFTRAQSGVGRRLGAPTAPPG
jgi:methionine sulfoxide reductase heme-binding subunit